MFEGLLVLSWQGEFLTALFPNFFSVKTLLKLVFSSNDFSEDDWSKDNVSIEFACWANKDFLLIAALVFFKL